MLNPERPPEFDAAHWLNVDVPPTLASLKGRVVVVCVFQPHCPGSLGHGVPQARRLAENFDPSQVVVLGLVTPFERPGDQSEKDIAAFAKAEGLSFPIAIDRVSEDGEPTATMVAYELRGTPSVLVYDRQGRVRRHYLGEAADMRLASEIMALVIEHPEAPRDTSIAIERLLHAALVDPDAHHHHDHEGGCCGGHHDHAHDHDHGHHHHAHGHEHGKDGCCGNPDCKN